MASEKLTNRAAQAAKPKENPYKLSDGHGLHLLVKPSGSKLWRLKYRIGGREKLRSYGIFPAVSLEQARKLAEQDLAHVRRGVDPVRKSREEQAQARLAEASTFQAVAQEWVERRMHTWRSEKHKADVLRSLDVDICPKLGGIPVSEITPVAVLDCIRALEDRGLGETAYRALQRVGSIFKYAIATGRCTTNPARDLTPALKKKKVVHHPALPEREMGEFLRKLEDYDGYVFTQVALKLVHLTALRSRELRLGEWEEIQLEGRHPEWRVPAGRMKMESDHLVPLSKQAVALLRLLRTLSGDAPLVFPGRNNPARPLSENTMNHALWSMGYKERHSTHGARSVFSTIANESGLWNPDAIERQIAHAPGNRIRAAYHRGEHLDERRRLMQWYADYLDRLRDGADIIDMSKRRRRAV